MTGRSFITVATFSTAPEAHLLRGLLQEAGIDAFLVDESVVQANWLYSQAVGGIKLQVYADQREAALEVMQSARSAAAESQQAEAHSPSAVRCPRCRSERVARRAGHVGLTLLAWAFMGYPIPLGGRRWVCAQCGKEWRSRWEGVAEEPADAHAPAPALSAELDAAVVPWRMRRPAAVLALLGASVLLLVSQRLDWISVAEALVLAMAIFALIALFTLRWQRVVLTAAELRLEDGDQIASHPLRELRAREYGGGVRVVEAHGTPVLAPISARTFLPEVVLLADADLLRIWERIRWLNRM